jgi:hypothetical protein
MAAQPSYRIVLHHGAVSDVSVILICSAVDDAVVVVFRHGYGVIRLKNVLRELD